MGCGSKTFMVQSTSQVPQNAHYVIIESGFSGQKVYDCMSMPDGTTWEPQCVLVTMHSAPVGVRRDQVDFEGKPVEEAEAP